MLSEVADAIPETGLKSFKMVGCWDSNIMDQAPIDKLAAKMQNLKSLHLQNYWAYRVPAENRDKWMVLAQNILHNKNWYLENLTISNTASDAERGLWVLRCLKASGINTLKELNLSSGKQVPLSEGHPDFKKDVNHEWFGG